ncbi:MAG: NIPSNAP family protein [Planctomycetota bacterium]
MHYSVSLAALAAIALLFAFSTATAADAKDTRCFEMRVYYAAEGKLDALNTRFRDHTLKLFEKHGITNIGYWMPIENTERKLIYVLAYPTREARETSWKAFMADPDWKAAYAASEKDGKLVTKIEQIFFHATDYTPVIAASKGAEPRTFELRTYTCTPNNLVNINARFRDHTIKLFEKHGMTNFAYWNLDEKQPEWKNKDAKQPLPSNTLLYILAHKSKDAADASFKAFRADPDWVAAKEASEKAAGGSLTEKDGVKSVFMVPTDYSPSK